MNTYIIVFALTKPEKKYKSFFSALEKLGAVKVLPNSFITNTTRDIEEMRIALLPYLEKPDRLIISVANGEIAIRNALCSNQVLQRVLVDERENRNN